MKDTKAGILSDAFRCACGAMPYNPEHHPKGQVWLVRFRKSKHANDGGWSVVCTRCGRVGERDRTQIGAADKWQLQRYKYGPLKEDKGK